MFEEPRARGPAEGRYCAVMSQENVEIVQGFLEALWDRRDLEAALRFADPDLELDWSQSRAPYAGVIRGYEAATEWWNEVAEAFSDYRVERRGFTDCGPSLVVVEQSILGQGRGSGIAVRATGATIWKVRDGKVASGKLFQDKAAALEAAGLGE